MIKYFPYTMLCLIGLSILIQVEAVEFPAKPPKAHYYVDEANLLKTEDAAYIDQTAAALLKEERIPIITVTLPSLVSYRAENMTVEEYAEALFNKWGIGSKQRNYGILLLVSVGDRKARIELGAGWGRSHDQDAKYIMDELIIPSFKAGDFSGGIRNGVEALDKMARGLALPAPKTPWWVPVAMIGGLVLIIGVIISLFKSGRHGWGWALLAALGLLLIFLLRNSGGSGGSFGGGFSGGGGASGSW